MAYGIRLIGGIITLYLFYVWTFVCPLTTIDTESTNSLTPINHHFCSLSNKYIKPQFYPIYQAHINPVLINLDESLHVGENIDKSIEIIHNFNHQYKISDYYHRVCDLLIDSTQQGINYFQDNITPQLSRWFKLFILRIRMYYEISKINLEYYLYPTINKTYKQVVDKLKSIEFINDFINWINEIYLKLATSKHALKLQQKSNFLQNEFKNLVTFDDFNPKEIKNNVLQIVKDMLGEKSIDEKSIEQTLTDEPIGAEIPLELTPTEQTISSETANNDVSGDDEVHVEEVSAEETPDEEVPVEETPIEEAPIEETPTEEEPIEETFKEETTIEDTPTEEISIEETHIEDTPIEKYKAEVEEEEEVVIEEEVVVEEDEIEIGPEIPSSNDDEDEDDSELEPETIHLTSTIVVTQSESEVTGVNDAVSTDDPVWGPILHEINYWETKVNKTIILALNNLKIEMKPKIDEIINDIKPEISDILQDLQKTNYEQYQLIHRKISQINKDYEEIKLTNNSLIETITRQEIRDDISNCTKTSEDASLKIQEILNNNHEKLLTIFYEVLQDTIDILETSSESVINEFKNQLNYFIYQSDLKDDDEINWTIWKKYHKIKESLFEFRDNLIKDADDYQVDNKKNSVDKLTNDSLNEWDNYLKNIEFHLNFLISDNIEFLQLIRAKANIAFQMREGLVDELNRIEKEKQEQLEKEKEREQKKAKDIKIETPELVDIPNGAGGVVDAKQVYFEYSDDSEGLGSFVNDLIIIESEDLDKSETISQQSSTVSEIYYYEHTVGPNEDVADANDFIVETTIVESEPSTVSGEVEISNNDQEVIEEEVVEEVEIEIEIDTDVEFEYETEIETEIETKTQLEIQFDTDVEIEFETEYETQIETAFATEIGVSNVETGSVDTSSSIADVTSQSIESSPIESVVDKDNNNGDNNDSNDDEDDDYEVVVEEEQILILEEEEEEEDEQETAKKL